MDRENEALQRRMAERAARDTAADSSSGDGSSSYTVREGVTRAIDPEDMSTLRNQDESTEARPHRRVESMDSRRVDPALDQPPDLPESVDVTNAAPDGTTIGGSTLASPTGEAVGGSGLSDAVQSGGSALGGDALGGSRLDPLGMLSRDTSDIGAPTDREVEQAIGAHGRSQVSMEVEIGEIKDITPKPMGLEIGEIKDITPKPMGLEIGEIEDVTPLLGGGDAVPDPGYARPDPTGGYDVITQSSIDAAIKTHDPGVYAQTTADGDASGGTAAAVQRAASVNDPQQLTNYGPEGLQTVEVDANWAPPPDVLFDPLPEGASAGMAGAEFAMADAGASLGGGGEIGSGQPPDFEPPPDPPPGDDPVGPPDGGGGEG